jgi:hypothetical protein
MKGLENVKMIKSPKVSPKKRNNKSYDKFLKSHPKSQHDPKSQPDKNKKVIRVQRKRQSPNKISRDIRDINNIERHIEINKSIKVPTQNKSNDNKPINHIIEQPVTMKSPKPTPIKQTVYNGPQIVKSYTKSPKRKVRIADIDVRETRPSKPKPTKPTPSNTRSSRSSGPSRSSRPSRSNTRPLKPSKPSKPSRSNNRKITIKNNTLDEKDIKNVSRKMKQIRNTNKDEIKKELEKQGVKVSGKSDSLLKDIYLYSKVCNINIQHEK